MEDDGRSGHPKMQEQMKMLKSEKSCSETEAKNLSRLIIYKQ